MPWLHCHGAQHVQVEGHLSRVQEQARVMAQRQADLQVAQNKVSKLEQEVADRSAHTREAPANLVTHVTAHTVADELGGSPRDRSGMCKGNGQLEQVRVSGASSFATPVLTPADTRASAPVTSGMQQTHD